MGQLPGCAAPFYVSLRCFNNKACSPNQVLKHAARATVTPLVAARYACGSRWPRAARANKGSGQSKSLWTQVRGQILYQTFLSAFTRLANLSLHVETKIYCILGAAAKRPEGRAARGRPGNVWQPAHCSV